MRLYGSFRHGKTRDGFRTETAEGDPRAALIWWAVGTFLSGLGFVIPGLLLSETALGIGFLIIGAIAVIAGLVLFAMGLSQPAKPAESDD
jgi:uncharacterized membrane protein